MAPVVKEMHEAEVGFFQANLWQNFEPNPNGKKGILFPNQIKKNPQF